jgi:hypothetical protein
VLGAVVDKPPVVEITAEGCITELPATAELPTSVTLTSVLGTLLIVPAETVLTVPATGCADKLAVDVFTLGFAPLAAEDCIVKLTTALVSPKLLTYRSSTSGEMAPI